MPRRCSSRAAVRARATCCATNRWPRRWPRFAREAADAFYRGRIADAIVATLQRGGNPMTLGDLAAQRTERTAPLKIEWHGCEILRPPAEFAGGRRAHGARRARERRRARTIALWTHLAIEALKRAFDVRDSRVRRSESDARARPNASSKPGELERLRASIDPERARPRLAHSARGGTIAIVAVDAEGRAVSLIESLYMNFGSGLVARGTGVFLQNRGAYFSLEPGHANELAGRKRPLHTLSPGMLLRGGKPELVYGTMGGDGQPQTHLQLIHNVYERGLSVQQAIDAPRFVYGRDSEAAFADSVRVESRFAPEIVAGLRARGHVVQVLGRVRERARVTRRRSRSTGSAARSPAVPTRAPIRSHSAFSSRE